MAAAQAGEARAMEAGAQLGYQALALAVWVVAAEFWALAALAALAGSAGGAQPGRWLWAGAKFFALVRASALVAGLQLMLALARHRACTVRRRVVSRAVRLVSAALAYPFTHALHAAAGWAVVLVFLRLVDRGGERAEEGLADLAQLVGLANGAAFSVWFLVSDANELRFPEMQQKRLVRLRAALGGTLVGAAARAAVTGATLLSVTPCTPQNAARLYLLGLVVQLTMGLAAELYRVLATEYKRMGMATWHPVTDEQELQLLVDNLSRSARGSVEEALLGLPMTALADPKAFRASAGSPKACKSKLMVVAKGEELRTQPTSSAVGPNRELSAAARAGEAVGSWWAQVSEATVFKSGAGEPWEQVAALRQRRFDAVLQAVYAADAHKPGVAFRGRERLSAAQELARARAFLDLSVLAQFSAGRRRLLVNDRAAWFRTFEACLAVIDALTLSLTVATRHAALEPTVPRTGAGQSLLNVLVLGPRPEDAELMSAQERRDLAWRADRAARRLKRQPWVSTEWWREATLGEFGEFDPVAAQACMEQKEECIRLAQQQLAHGARGNASEPGSRHFTWEQQWQRQQKERLWRLLRGATLGLFYRTPREQCEALFADEQVVRWGALALGNLVANAQGEDETGCVASTVPAALDCLLSCLLAIDAYSKAPVFLGSVDPLPELEGNQLARSQVMAMRFVIERAIFAITTTYHERLATFRFSPDRAALLQSIVNFECKWIGLGGTDGTHDIADALANPQRCAFLSQCHMDARCLSGPWRASARAV